MHYNIALIGDGCMHCCFGALQQSNISLLEDTTHTSQHRHIECLVQAVPMEEDKGAGSAEDHVLEAPDMIPLNGEGPDVAPQSIAKPRGGTRGRGRGGRGRGAKVGRPCPRLSSLLALSSVMYVLYSMNRVPKQKLLVF